MAEIAPYPFARWARITRAEARAQSDLARALGALGARSALADAGTVLGAEVRIEGAGWTLAMASAHVDRIGESIGFWVAQGPETVLVALAPGIARVVADRVVGGTGEDVALGPTPLSRGEAGLVGYVVARALARSGSSASLVDAVSARRALEGWGARRVLVCSCTLVVGGQRGQASLAAPADALLRLAVPRAPRVDPTLPVRASIVIGDARLPRREVARLAKGDVVVPDTLTLDPRLADTGRARLVVARSARAFELELREGAFHVVRPTSLAAPRAPSSWRPRNKGAPMSQPETDTLQSLADVEVELSIELARLEMPVTEVAALAPGVVVTTGRLVGERVALRAGERVLAWGELVDVEGEVGVRVTELAGASND